MKDLLRRAGLGVLRHPRKVALLALLLAAATAFSLSRLRVDPNVEHLLPPNDPTLRLTRALQGDAAPTRTLFVILRADSFGALEAALPRVTDRLRASPHLAQVTATRSEFAGARADWIRRSPLSFMSPDTLDALASRLAPAGRAAELESLKGRLADDPLGGKPTALADPLGLRWIFDEGAGRLSARFPFRLRPGSDYLVVDKPAVAFLRALGREDAANIKASRALLDDVRARLAESTAGTGATAELAGGYVSAVTQEAALRRDMTLEIIVSTIAVMLYVWWFTRSFIAPPVIFIPVVLSIVGALAVGGELLGPLTPVVLSSAAILIAQGIDFPMHFFCRYRAERASRDREASLHAAQVGMARPFAGIAATTLAAFLSLLASRFPGFRQFGFVLSVGLLLCLVTALLLFPVLLMPLDRRVRPTVDRTPWIVTGAERILRTRWRIPIAIVLVLVGAASWIVVARNGVRMDLDLRNAMAPGDPGRAALERLEGDLGVALMPVFTLVDSTVSVDDLRARAAALRTSGAAASVDGLPELVPSPGARAAVDRFLERVRGWKDATLADLGRAGFRPDPFRPGLEKWEAMFAAPGPQASDLERPEFEPLRRSMRYADGARDYHVLVLFPPRSLWSPDDRRVFDRTVRATLGNDAQLFSPFHLPDHYSEVLTGDLTRVVMITAIGIVLFTLASVGSLKDGLWALAPVFLATGMTLATAVLLGGAVNVINMAAIPIVLAVGVDGGIHFMVRFRESRDRDPAATIREVGPGIWGSAATTLLGFGSIATSVTPGMASMGYFVVAGTVTSLLASLFLLPGLLQRKAA